MLYKVINRNVTMRIRHGIVGAVVAAAAGLLLPGMAREPAPTGPGTEKRFPPLQVPAGFKATLFACDPLIEYPSAIAQGPRPGTLFVAVDYMTGLGTDIIRRDEIRLIEDSDGDGYADRATVYAAGFNSIEGLTFHDGTVYAMHAPYLTALRDTDGNGIADVRTDLVTGLGLKPEDNPVRLHCANGLVMGHDGWLYLALGDHGCDVRRPEGDRLVLNGGGILRCRPDGRDLHVFATGLRNIYDVALDEALNVFVRDNENDGGDYKIRVCHSFFGADHGYPYLYYERPQEALPPLADLGLGSSAGGLCYLEAQFPAEYRGDLFFCEWGRAVVHYRPRRAGAGFAPLKEMTFAAGADTDPYGFKPTDLVVDHDGSLLVADWCDGQRPRRGRGRIYRLSHAAAKPAAPPAEPATVAEALKQLDSDSYLVRCRAQRALERRGFEGQAAVLQALARQALGVRARLHAAWIIARADARNAVRPLLDLAGTDPSPRVQAQAIRALADLSDPVLVEHRLDAAAVNGRLPQQLAAMAGAKDPEVVLEIVVALGRLRWSGLADWLRDARPRLDATLAHAGQQALRQAGAWAAVLRLFDDSSQPALQSLALQAMSWQYEETVVEGLMERLARERSSPRRIACADALARVYKKRGPWVYWGYRPPPRPVNTVAWARTEAIEKALNRALSEPDVDVRLAVVRKMQREKVPVQMSILRAWLQSTRRDEETEAILDALRDQPPRLAAEVLAAVALDTRQAVANRQRAVTLLSGESGRTHLRELAERVEDGPVLAAVIGRLDRQAATQAAAVLDRALQSRTPAVRSSAVSALAELNPRSAAARVVAMLDDSSAGVRQAAATAAGKLRVRSASERLLALTRDADGDVRRACLEALRQLGEQRALPVFVAALADRQTESAGLAGLAALGGPEHAGHVVDLARRSPTSEILLSAVQALHAWRQRTSGAEDRRRLDRAVAEIQGLQGTLLFWQVQSMPPAGLQEPAAVLPQDGTNTPAVFADGRVNLATAVTQPPAPARCAITDVWVPGPSAVQFLGSSSGTLDVWLNGKRVYRRPGEAAFQPDSDRFAAQLAAGNNRLVVAVKAARGSPEFQLRFRRLGSNAERERLVHAALSRQGNPARGRALFLDVEKTQCLKCHRLGDQGERIGPELTGVGSRFARVYLVESILEPSRTIASSYQTLVVTLKDGRILSGVKAGETAAALVLADNQGNKHTLARSAIEQLTPSPLSIMPDGLEKRLTLEEFVDLVAFLAAEKGSR